MQNWYGFNIYIKKKDEFIGKIQLKKEKRN